MITISNVWTYGNENLGSVSIILLTYSFYVIIKLSSQAGNLQIVRYIRDWQDTTHLSIIISTNWTHPPHDNKPPPSFVFSYLTDSNILQIAYFSYIIAYILIGYIPVRWLLQLLPIKRAVDPDTWCPYKGIVEWRE